MSYRQEIYRTFVVPVVVSVIMAAAAYLAYAGLHLVLGITVSTVVSVFVGMAVYGIGMVSFHGLTAEELALLPKGTVLIRWMNKLGLLK